METAAAEHDAVTTHLKAALEQKDAEIAARDNKIAELTVDLNLANESREIVHKRMSLQEAENGNIMEKVRKRRVGCVDHCVVLPCGVKGYSGQLQRRL